jgi:hypothetical protein
MMDEQNERVRRRKNRETYADAYAQLTKTIRYPKGAQPARKGLNNWGALDGDTDQIVAYAQAELEKLKLLDPDEYAGEANPHAGKPSGALDITWHSGRMPTFMGGRGGA